MLRAENAKLRAQANSFVTPIKSQVDLVDVFDNPFEPPPELRTLEGAWLSSPTMSTCASSPLSRTSGSVTPYSDSCVPSGYATPVPSTADRGVELGSGFGQFCNGVAFVWFPMGERLQIPHGVVQQARSIFERNSSIPSFFTQQTQQIL